jgi:cytochrome c biogenesis protein CcmG, thiol:disulfide interchange protein DsbE
MARRRRLLGWSLAVAILAALTVVGLSTNRSPSLGRPAPALPHELLAGPPVTLADLTTAFGGGSPAAAGRGALVVFWASWCEPCAREAPALERLSRSAAGRGRIVGVDWSDALAGARSFIRRYSWTFSNLRDSEGTVGNEYHMIGLPTTFVIDAHGRIRTVLRGPQDEASLGRALASVS